MQFLIYVLLIDLLIFAPVGAWLATQKGRTAVEGAALGAVLGVLGIIVIGLAPAAHGQTRKCPQCAEQVLAEAKICRYCGSPLTPTALAAPPKTQMSTTTFVLLILVLIALIVLVYESINSGF